MAFPINKQNIIAHPCLRNYQTCNNRIFRRRNFANLEHFKSPQMKKFCDPYLCNLKLCDPKIPTSRSGRLRLVSKNFGKLIEIISSQVHFCFNTTMIFRMRLSRYNDPQKDENVLVVVARIF